MFVPKHGQEEGATARQLVNGANSVVVVCSTAVYSAVRMNARLKISVHGEGSMTNAGGGEFKIKKGLLSVRKIFPRCESDSGDCSTTSDVRQPEVKSEEWLVPSLV